LISLTIFAGVIPGWVSFYMGKSVKIIGVDFCRSTAFHVTKQTVSKH